MHQETRLIFVPFSPVGCDLIHLQLQISLRRQALSL
jgi:hypothetical protein